MTYLLRFIVPIGQYWPVIGLPTPAFLPQYASLFVIGIWACRGGWLGAFPRWAGTFGLLLAVIATAVFFCAAALGSVFEGGLLVGHGNWQSLAFALWESLFAVGVILALLVLFRRRFNVGGRLGRFLSRQAYAVYIIHPLVLVALGRAFAWLNAIAVVKFLVVAAIAIPFCWASAYLVLSLPFVRRVL